MTTLDRYLKLLFELQKIEPNTTTHENGIVDSAKAMACNFKSSLDSILDGAKSIELHQHFCRGVTFAHANSPLSPAGSLKRNGRYHFTAYNMPSLYFSENEETVQKERRVSGFSPVPPHSCFWFETHLHRILDLSTSQKCFQAGIQKEGLDLEWEWLNDEHALPSYSQVIAFTAWSAMYEGLLAESVRNRGYKNLILFPENLQISSIVRLFGTRQQIGNNIPPFEQELVGQMPAVTT